MARSRREQREQLQRALQSRSGEQAGPAQRQPESVEAAKPPEGTTSAGAPLSGTQSVRDEAQSRSFSEDPSPFSRPTLSPDSSAYRELVALAAYYRAERRGFASGGDIEDWLAAEREVAARLDGPGAP